jgi:hypothetical protein
LDFPRRIQFAKVVRLAIENAPTDFRSHRSVCNLGEAGSACRLDQDRVDAHIGRLDDLQQLLALIDCVIVRK